MSPDCEKCGASNKAAIHQIDDVPPGHKYEPVAKFDYLCDQCLNKQCKKTLTYGDPQKLMAQGFVGKPQ